MFFKILPTTIFILSAIITNAQKTRTFSELQKEQAAKADVFIVNSKMKVKDSFAIAAKDTMVITKITSQKCRIKRNKKAP